MAQQIQKDTENLRQEIKTEAGHLQADLDFLVDALENDPTCVPDMLPHIRERAIRLDRLGYRLDAFLSITNNEE